MVEIGGDIDETDSGTVDDTDDFIEAVIGHINRYETGADISLTIIDTGHGDARDGEWDVDMIEIGYSDDRKDARGEINIGDDL
jgi:hypothetical protein